MIKKLTLILTSIMLLAGLAMPSVVFAQAAAPAPASASKTAVCQGVQDASGSTNCGQTPVLGQDPITNLITTVVKVFSIIIGVVSVVMIMYGGFRYITSGGDSGKITSAKDTILYAVIGLSVAALAQFIVQYVLNRLP